MSAIGEKAENQVCAGSRPPKRLPYEHWRRGLVHSSVVVVPSLNA